MPSCPPERLHQSDHQQWMRDPPLNLTKSFEHWFIADFRTKQISVRIITTFYFTCCRNPNFFIFFYPRWAKARVRSQWKSFLCKLHDKAIPPAQNIQFPPQHVPFLPQGCWQPWGCLRSTLQVNFLPSGYQSGEPPLCTDTISNTMLCFIHSKFMV